MIGTPAEGKRGVNRMRWVKRILIPVVIVSLVGVGGYFLYSEAYSRGETTGYDYGYSAGEEAGYRTGEQEGYASGDQDGYEKGYIAGEQEGYTTGEQDGYDKGYVAGKQHGYDDGLEAGFGHGHTLRDPTYEEAIAFLKEDRTDENEYIMGSYGIYVCTHFTRDVCNSAEKAGLRCAAVILRYSDGQAHTIVAFATIDKGWVYFEPQEDLRVEPIIGKKYHQCVETEEGETRSPPLHDDTIMDILVIW